MSYPRDGEKKALPANDTSPPGVCKRRLRIPRPTTRSGRRDYDLLQSLADVSEAAADLQNARLRGEEHAAEDAAGRLAIAVPQLTERFLTVWESRMSAWRRARKKK
jgi:hypothetical protein